MDWVLKGAFQDEGIGLASASVMQRSSVCGVTDVILRVALARDDTFASFCPPAQILDVA